MSDAIAITEEIVRGVDPRRSWFLVLHAAGWGCNDVGYLELRLEGGVPVEIFFVSTAKMFRRRGVATALVQHAIRLGIARGSTRLGLTVHDSEVETRRIYERAGFTVRSTDSRLHTMALDLTREGQS